VDCRFAAARCAGHRQETTRSCHGEGKGGAESNRRLAARLADGDELAQRLEHIAKHSEELSAGFTARRSGGSAAVQTSAFKKDVAADRALDLLAKYGDGRRPTTMPDGHFYRTARLLSGQKGNMARACAAALSDK
jgi:hypothetical protein